MEKGYNGILLAFLYRKKYADTDLISLDKVKRFVDAFNTNLKTLDFDFSLTFDVSKKSYIYFIRVNEDGIPYVILNPFINWEKEFDNLVDNLPKELFIVSRFDNVLKEIGLIQVDGIIKDRNVYYKEFKKKHDLPDGFQTEEIEKLINSIVSGEVDILSIDNNMLSELINNKVNNDKIEKQQIRILKHL